MTEVVLQAISLSELQISLFTHITSEAPPKIHHLINLAERASIFDDLSEGQRKLLTELNPLNIEARYPEYKERIAQALTHELIARLLNETEAFLCWTKQRLKK